MVVTVRCRLGKKEGKGQEKEKEKEKEEGQGTKAKSIDEGKGKINGKKKERKKGNRIENNAKEWKVKERKRVIKRKASMEKNRK